MRRPSSYLLALLLLALALTPTLQAPAQEGDSFSFSGDETSIVLAEGRERTRLVGNARVVSDATTIEAGEIELYGEDFRYVLCTGGVNVVDEENDLYFSSGELFYDRESELTRARYRVVLEDRENEIVVKGGFVETRENGAYVQAQIGVRILRDDLTARSEFVRYDRDRNVLELSGYPVVFWKGDEYRASRISIDLDRDEIELEGGVEGTVTSDEEDEETESAETGAAGGETESAETGAADGETESAETGAAGGETDPAEPAAADGQPVPTNGSGAGGSGVEGEDEPGGAGATNTPGDGES